VRSDLPPPLLGQHTDEVLQSVLNYSLAQVAELKKQQVV
jgi:crotonobetainyl-CoA:carnitine CoA-transferase CaiB-like acyl-CoA transferase